jgi:hypothetical protein
LNPALLQQFVLETVLLHTKHWGRLLMPFLIAA